ncbi:MULTISPECIES: type II toxin-antitoxin system VapC family toxin [Protofrankia]|uniref:Ribonuclease VapC n=1 Tax=Candidatus Protofrankia datiscae TaxID=2716812 RepID=F8AUV9_9ACTN|nr:MULTISPECIES: type II toxin-antitoxin system VapC family toxin [Protofrankia]AEH08156.1 PilT protein domain protein [Candidatus Protofrankia datiscae]
MIALDTNVVSELMRARADPGVVAWIDSQPADEIYLTAVTMAELRYGVARLPEGRRRTDLTDRLQRAVEAGFTGRVLPFDDDAAAHYADIVVGREQQGLPIAMADAQIAAICRSHSADLATRNTKDFAHTGIDLIDPWQATAD